MSTSLIAGERPYEHMIPGKASDTGRGKPRGLAEGVRERLHRGGLPRVQG
jgi:hypothetical protein